MVDSRIGVDAGERLLQTKKLVNVNFSSGMRSAESTQLKILLTDQAMPVGFPEQRTRGSDLRQSLSSLYLLSIPSERIQ